MMRERRKYDRRKCAFKVRLLELNQKPMNPRCSQAFGIDISGGGICFAFVSVFDKKDRIKLAIEKIAGRDIKPIIAIARIVWSKSYYNFVSTFGCKFTEIPTRRRGEIIKFAS